MARAVERAGEESLRRESTAAAEPERSPLSATLPDVQARVLGLQRAAGNAAVARLVADRGLEAMSGAPVPSSLTTYAGDAPSEDELDVSRPASQNGSAPPAPPGPAPPSAPPGPSAQPAPPPASPPAPACVLTTRTVAAAPDGTGNTRTTVGVNERVVMTAAAAGAWTATGGRLSATAGTSVTWTAPVAPSAGQDFTIVSTPPGAGAAPCSVTMRVVPPARRRLTVRGAAAVPPGQRVYTAGLAGSGFVADVRIHPLSVSFSRLQVREGTATAVATGYYNTVLGWNGSVHPLGTWLTLDANNGGIIDTVGTNPPGSGAPFSPGRFTWPIPQFYRRVGSTGNGRRYSVGTHRQRMNGTAGVETTSKEGATRTR
jgi:hypothetical protein